MNMTSKLYALYQGVLAHSHHSPELLPLGQTGLTRHPTPAHTAHSHTVPPLEGKGKMNHWEQRCETRTSASANVTGNSIFECRRTALLPKAGVWS